MRFLLVAALLIVPAAALEHDHAQLGDAGRFYQNWKQPSSRSVDGSRLVSCCSNYDCERTDIVRRDGRWYARNHKMRPGEDVLIPDALLEHNQSDPRESPDGQNHVCMNRTGVLCATLGSGN